MLRSALLLLILVHHDCALVAGESSDGSADNVDTDVRRTKLSTGHVPLRQLSQNEDRTQPNQAMDKRDKKLRKQNALKGKDSEVNEGSGFDKRVIHDVQHVVDSSELLEIEEQLTDNYTVTTDGKDIREGAVEIRSVNDEAIYTSEMASIRTQDEVIEQQQALAAKTKKEPEASDSRGTRAKTKRDPSSSQSLTQGYASTSAPVSTSDDTSPKRKIAFGPQSNVKTVRSKSRKSSNSESMSIHSKLQGKIGKTSKQSKKHHPTSMVPTRIEDTKSPVVTKVPTTTPSIPQPVATVFDLDSTVDSFGCDGESAAGNSLDGTTKEYVCNIADGSGSQLVEKSSTTSASFVALRKKYNLRDSHETQQPLQNLDIHRPTPSQQHQQSRQQTPFLEEERGMIIVPSHGELSVVDKIRVYADDKCAGCDAVSYRVEGRLTDTVESEGGRRMKWLSTFYSSFISAQSTPKRNNAEKASLGAQTWQLISEGDFPWINESNPTRNPAGSTIASTYESGDSSLSYTEATFDNSEAYKEYKVTFPSIRNESLYLILAEVELSGKLLVETTQQPSLDPTSDSPTYFPSVASGEPTSIAPSTVWPTASPMKASSSAPSWHPSLGPSVAVTTVSTLDYLH